MYYIELDRVSISKNVDSYKMVMIIGFVIVEFIGARFLSRSYRHTKGGEGSKYCNPWVIWKLIFIVLRTMNV
jgi:hypothetical protein